MGLPRVRTHKARRNIYKIGKKTPADNKQGFHHTRYVPCDETDEVLIPSGSMYYTWNRKGRPTCYSLTPPEFPRLVSEYVEKTEEFQQGMQSVSNEDERDELVQQVEEFRDELQERLDNMPWQLQESSVLNERIEELDELIGEINDIEVE